VIQKIRCLFLIQGFDIAASRYRVLQYIPYLEENDIQCDVIEFPDTTRQYAELYRILPKYDSVFVQRKRFHFPFLSLFRRRANRIIYDLDDAVMYRNSLERSPYSRTRQRRFANMVRLSDLVIAGNLFLKEKALAFNNNVVLIPTSIEMGRYTIKDYSIKKDKITIGWIGDHGSIHYLKGLKAIWEEIGRRFPGRVEFKIICDTFFDCEYIPVRKVYWSSDTEIEELKDIDIGVMPLLDDLWSWGKCGLKILQYYGVGVPAVCTPVGINRDVVSDGVSGFWAKTEEDWIKGLSVLIEDAALRQKMGLAGRKALEGGYTKEINASRIGLLLKA